MEKRIVKNPELKNIVREFVAAGKTETDFVVHCTANFLDFEKGKKTIEEYWLYRYAACIEFEVQQNRFAKKSEDADLMEAAAMALAEVKLLKNSTGGSGKGRKKSEEKIRMENEAKENLAKKLAEVKAARELRANAELRKAAAELATVTTKNEFDKVPGGEYIPEVPAARSAM